MSFDPIITLNINRPCFKFCFHDSKVFFDFPTLLINSDDFLYITIKIGYHCIETIISGFIVFFILVKTVDAFFGNFTIIKNKPQTGYL